MQLAQGVKLWWSGEQLQLVYIDDRNVLVESVDSIRRRALIALESLHQAIADGCVMAAKEEPKCTRSPDWYQALPPRQQSVLDRRIKYADYFSRNCVKVSQQTEIIQRIFDSFNHDGVPPPPSTVRRWAQRYRESDGDIASLLDNRYGRRIR